MLEALFAIFVAWLIGFGIYLLFGQPNKSPPPNPNRDDFDHFTFREDNDDH